MHTVLPRMAASMVREVEQVADLPSRSELSSDQARALLADAAAEHAAAKAAFEAARGRLHAVIQVIGTGKDALLRQVDVVNATGYTREYVARIGRGEVA